MSRHRSIAALERFAKAEKLPTPGRVSGGALRTACYDHPGRVVVIEGKNVEGTRRSSNPEAPRGAAGLGERRPH